jgi:hypothetical protein
MRGAARGRVVKTPPANQTMHQIAVMQMIEQRSNAMRLPSPTRIN